MAIVTRFIRKAERFKRDKADALRQHVLQFEDLPDSLRTDMLIAIQRAETGGVPDGWTFNMISPAQCLVIWEAIHALPTEDRPQQVDRLFKYVLTHVETNTGAVTLTREELADKIGTEPKNISTMMGTLEKMGVIFRRRIKVNGMRGPGVARYFLNPHVGWNGSLNLRKETAETAPLPFNVIEGGKSQA